MLNSFAEGIYDYTSKYIQNIRRIPVSTYRLQLNRYFRFNDVRNITAYLHDLGITDVYLSPYFKARHGSLHGYDIVDYNSFNPEIGSKADFEKLCQSLKKYNMSHILDLVPNHMGLFENMWWADVLENGASSPYARYFDIDWTPVKEELKGKVLLPVLEDLYGNVLENGHIKLSLDTGVFSIKYRDHTFPIDPRTITHILQPCLDRLKVALDENNADFMEFQSIITAYNNLPERTKVNGELYNQRKRENEVIKRRLNALLSRNSSVKRAVQARIREINGIVGQMSSFDNLHLLLEEQVYRLSFWRVAGEEINYRRFFDINELVALTMEDFNVFSATHKLVLELLATGKIGGLRIDHVDGLFLPGEYLRRLQRQYFTEIAMQLADGKYNPDEIEPAKLRRDLLRRFEVKRAESNDDPERFNPVYIVVEKILAAKEDLKPSWPVAGTTGYEFSAMLNGIFINKKNETAMHNTYRWFTGKTRSFQDVVYECKNLVLKTSMSAELNMLAHQLNRVSERTKIYRDLTLNSLRDAIREVTACFPAYRTYINAYTEHIDENDRSVINIAVAEAKKRNPALSPVVLDFLKNTLLLEYSPDMDKDDRDEQRLFTMRFQQFTGPVMAKGMEDTAFYIYNPLISLNEVGSNPHRFGNSVDEFHKHNSYRLRNAPFSMVSTSTHDSKRSEDVRARLNVISEIPQDWKNALQRWSHINRNKRSVQVGENVPDANDEYYLYQIIAGSYPLDPCDKSTLDIYSERIKNHMLKAVREAKQHTSWISPNSAYEEGLNRFISEILRPAPDNTFITDMLNFQTTIANCGLYNSLSQVVLKILSPGVPDLYQGNELFAFNLTDPDNRRKVNFSQRMNMLKQMKQRLSRVGGEAALAEELLHSKEDGQIKLYITWKSLNYRRNMDKELFQSGSYIPLKAMGEKKTHVCAFAWQKGRRKCLVIVPVLIGGLTQNATTEPLGHSAWGDSYILLHKEETGQTYHNIFTATNITPIQHEDTVILPLAEIFSTFPVAVLELTE